MILTEQPLAKTPETLLCQLLDCLTGLSAQRRLLGILSPGPSQVQPPVVSFSYRFVDSLHTRALPMSSIRDVAREAGVSVATVSRALSSPEKVSPASMAKVQKAIERVGYSPNMLARNFRSARSYTIVVLVPDIANTFYSQLIRDRKSTSMNYSNVDISYDDVCKKKNEI